MSIPRVVIVGGGFGGLAAAKALRNGSSEAWEDAGVPAQVILIDRTNHHVFQPLLYQVATSVLAPAQIEEATPGPRGAAIPVAASAPAAAGGSTGLAAATRISPSA